MCPLLTNQFRRLVDRGAESSSRDKVAKIGRARVCQCKLVDVNWLMMVVAQGTEVWFLGWFEHSLGEQSLNCRGFRSIWKVWQLEIQWVVRDFPGRKKGIIFCHSGASFGRSFDNGREV